MVQLHAWRTEDPPTPRPGEEVCYFGYETGAFQGAPGGMGDYAETILDVGFGFTVHLIALKQSEAVQNVPRNTHSPSALGTGDR